MDWRSWESCPIHYSHTFNRWNILYDLWFNAYEQTFRCLATSETSFCHLTKEVSCCWNTIMSMKSRWQIKKYSPFSKRGVISVPTECFVAVALLSLQKTFVADASLRAEQSFLEASDEPLHSRSRVSSVTLNPRGITQSTLQSTISHSIFMGISHKCIVINWSLNHHYFVRNNGALITFFYTTSISGFI